MAIAEKKVKLNTGSSLSAFLSHVIDEGVKSALAQKALTEKEKQDASSGGGKADDGEDDLFGVGGGGDDSSDDTGGSDASGGSASAGSDDDDVNANDGQLSSKTMDDEMDKLKKGDIKPRDIVDRLNAIRAGKSFKDEKVAKAMDEYINSLSKAEKVALFAFMRGVAQIVTGEVPGGEAEDPSEDPSDVKMKKGPAPEKVKHITPNVIKGGNKAGEQKKSGGSQPNSSQEDTTPPAPITPKRR